MGDGRIKFHVARNEQVQQAIVVVIAPRRPVDHPPNATPAFPPRP